MNAMQSHQAGNVFVWGLGLLAAVAVALSVPSHSDAGQAGQRCFGKPATIVRGSGNDTIQGTAGSDVIVAGGGNDTVAAGNGVDYVCGEGG
ncbi:MAG TPA: hypothetical protein VLA62_06335, partial [Solirubrobacterales bacterium]|nr:hypothetical protein [Solirubrobacterales bacterium]